MNDQDDFFAVTVMDGLDYDQAILVMGSEQISVSFGALAELAEAVDKMKPTEVQLLPSTHERWVAELAKQGIHPSKMQ